MLEFPNSNTLKLVNETIGNPTQWKDVNHNKHPLQRSDLQTDPDPSMETGGVSTKTMEHSSLMCGDVVVFCPKILQISTCPRGRDTMDIFTRPSFLSSENLALFWGTAVSINTVTLSFFRRKQNSEMKRKVSLRLLNGQICMSCTLL